MKLCRFFSFLLALSIPVAAAAFEWPLDSVDNNQTNSYFGQNRGGILSTSLVFDNPGEVKAIEKGRILVILTDENDDSDFFPSTLGNACLVEQDDKLITVYGNLNEFENSNCFYEERIESGKIIGTTGNSGWQNNKSSLELQIIDTMNKSAINPKLLLDRNDEAFVMQIPFIYLENKNGDLFDLRSTKTFNSGLYRIYQNRDSNIVPYKTTILVNGVITDQISYDTIIQENNQNCVKGKKKYTSRDIYPDDKRLLLGETMLTTGRSTLSVTLSDILNNQKQITYNISVY